MASRRRISRRAPQKLKTLRPNEKSYGLGLGSTKDGETLINNQGGNAKAVNLNLSGVDGIATGGISIKSLEVDGETLTTSMNNVSDFAGSGTFNSSGTYAGLRAQATTKSDVGLGSVSNNAQLTIANNLSDLNNETTARNNLDLGTSDSVSFQSLTLSDTLSVAQKLLLTGSEDLGSGAASSLVVPTSYFTTGGSETATLGVGTDGQVKIFSMIGFGGNMVITVSNAGWKSSGTGTLTFDAIGDSCTLIYESAAAKWMLIGNNGVVAA